MVCIQHMEQKRKVLQEESLSQDPCNEEGKSSPKVPFLKELGRAKP